MEACKEEPIRSYSRDEILQMLVMLMSFVGIKPENYPDKLTKTMLVSYIIGHLGDFTVNEFLIAFSLAVSGRLDVDVKHYNSFDAIYLNRVMAAYSRYRYQILKSKTLMLQQGSNSLSEEEIEQIMREGILEYFQTYKQRKHRHLKPSIFFDYLKKKKLLKYTADEAYRCYEQARELLVNENREIQKTTLSRSRQNELAADIRNLIEGNQGIDQRVKDQAKVLILHRYFDELISQNKELEKRI